MGVWYVTPFGRVHTDLPAAMRLDAERDRCAAILAAAKLPETCGDRIVVAPARGAQIAFTPRESVVTDTGGIVQRRAGYNGWDAIRRADAFDIMERAARRAHARHGGDADFVPPFSPGQVAAARDYAALSERVQSSGMRCASLEAARGGGGGGVAEAVAFDIRRLSALHRRIGDGIAKDVLRPSKGGARSAITVRRLVDRVCLGDMTLSAVAKASGWHKDGRLIEVLRRHLCAALDRMQGYGLAKPQDIA